ncbi:MAG: ABC transporter ATP-binding protein [Actinomycetota bacterium]|nr:ABC transporter ATP-binding protein [Actinomycetota bacterium]
MKIPTPAALVPAAHGGGPVLDVRDLSVCFGGEVAALGGVSFELDRGESLAVVGETGSGKSTLALCLAGLVQPPDARGSVRVAGQELIGADAETLRSLRYSTVALALQGAPFHPVMSVLDQVAEPLRKHRGIARGPARERARELAAEVLLDPALLDRFPHQLSGGERRRATLAMVLALDPELVVLDEPTAGLDPASRHELVERMGALASDRGFALVVISHDLPDTARLADRCLVLYAGQTMELGSTKAILTEPTHPYTWALVGAFPVLSTTKDLRPIRGRPPDARAVPRGCPYHPRCTQAEDLCASDAPPLVTARNRQVLCHFGGLKTLLSVKGVEKSFASRSGQVAALRGVSLELREGESLGVIGASGSGKSTLARILSGHLAPDAGEVFVEGEPLSTSWRGTARERRRRVQLVQQDPWDALSPRLTVAELVREPLDILGTEDRPAREAAVAEALDSVGLPCTGGFLTARSHELSGGQLQRISLARALIARPKLLIADEPTSMLDASEQARLLVVLRERQVEMGLGLVLVSHDVAAVRKVTDRIVILDAGQVVEQGRSDQVSCAPRSAAGRRLLEFAPAFPV